MESLVECAALVAAPTAVLVEAGIFSLRQQILYYIILVESVLRLFIIVTAVLDIAAPAK